MVPACISVMHSQDCQITTLREGMLRKLKDSTSKFVKLAQYQIQAETAKCPDMQQLIKYIIQGWPTKQQDVVQQLQAYNTFKEEMSVIDGLVFKGERIVIPYNLQSKALQAIHRSHMGIQKTLDRSKGCFYWSGISKDITNVCETCEECLKYAQGTS